MIDSNLVDKVNIPELVKALRCETEDMECEGCRYYEDYFCHVRTLQHDAAAAIEELEAKISELGESYSANLVAAMNGRLEPKRGEWSHVERVNRSWETDEIFGFVVQCSICGNKNIGESIYCPNCGAKMTGEQDVE